MGFKPRAPAVSLAAQGVSSAFRGLFRVDCCCVFSLALPEVFAASLHHH